MNYVKKLIDVEEEEALASYIYFFYVKVVLAILPLILYINIINSRIDSIEICALWVSKFIIIVSNNIFFKLPVSGIYYYMSIK